MLNREQPVWSVLETQGRTLKWFARKTGYSYAHILDMKSGSQAISAAFRQRASEALDIREDILFRDDGIAEVTEVDGGAA